MSHPVKVAAQQVQATSRGPLVLHPGLEAPVAARRATVAARERPYRVLLVQLQQLGDRAVQQRRAPDSGGHLSHQLAGVAPIHRERDVHPIRD